MSGVQSGHLPPEYRLMAAVWVREQMCGIMCRCMGPCADLLVQEQVCEFMSRCVGPCAYVWFMCRCIGFEQLCGLCTGQYTIEVRL